MIIATVLGARPQFVKASVVSKELQKKSQVEEILIHTGQHYYDEMSQVFFRELEIPSPKFNLGIGSMSQGAQVGRMLEEVEKVLLDIKPNCVLVYGDTNSTLAGALSAAKLNIPLAHIEAGLRSYNRKMPEEINRVLTDHLSTFLFAPTEEARKNLLKEGISNVYVVGDVMYDVSKIFGIKAEKESTIFQRLNLSPKKYFLATIHRPENTDNSSNLITIFEALKLLSKKYRVVCPLHPRTEASLKALNIFSKYSELIIKPVGFLDMMVLEKNSLLIITDSGGIQKEAFFYSVPCVTLRTETEWNELVELGWNVVIKPESVTIIVETVERTIGKKGKKAFPYGDGNAAHKIVDILIKEIQTF